MPPLPGLFATLGQSMKYLGERQRVIAQNIAHGDTPGYKARELEPPSFANMVDADAGPVRVVRPVVRPSERMSTLGTGRGDAGTVIDTDISETKPDGNTVTLEDQLLKMGQVQADFAALTNLYRKHMGLMKAALGRGGSV